MSTCLRAPEKRILGLGFRVWGSKIYVPEAGGPLKSNENQGFCGSAVYVPASGPGIQDSTVYVPASGILGSTVILIYLLFIIYCPLFLIHY